MRYRLEALRSEVDALSHGDLSRNTLKSMWRVARQERRLVAARVVEGDEGMKNLNFLVAAYIAIWLVFCGYLFSVGPPDGELAG